MFPTRSDTKRAVNPQKIAGRLKFRTNELEGLHYLFSESKEADNLICAFVFTYAKSRVSYDAVQLPC